MKKSVAKFFRTRIKETKDFYLNTNPDEYLWIWPMLVLGAIQLVAGMAQSANNKRPEMPKNTEATKEATELSRTLAQATTDPILSAQNQAIGQSQSEGINALKKTLKDPSQILSGVSSLVSGSQQQKRMAQTDFGMRKLGQQQNFIQALANAAQEERQAFNWNEAMKYQEKSAQSSALIGAGISNIGGGISENTLAKQNRELAQYVYGSNSTPSYATQTSNLNQISSLVNRDRNSLDNQFQNSLGTFN